MTFEDVLSDSFHLHLQAWRQSEGLSQKAAAERLDVPLPTLLQWLHGDRRPGPKHLAKLMKEFPPDAF